MTLRMERTTRYQDSTCLGASHHGCASPRDTRWGLDTFLGEGCSGILGVEPGTLTNILQQAPDGNGAKAACVGLGTGTAIHPKRASTIYIYPYL